MTSIGGDEREKVISVSNREKAREREAIHSKHTQKTRKHKLPSPWFSSSSLFVFTHISYSVCCLFELSLRPPVHARRQTAPEMIFADKKKDQQKWNEKVNRRRTSTGIHMIRVWSTFVSALYCNLISLGFNQATQQTMRSIYACLRSTKPKSTQTTTTEMKREKTVPFSLIRCVSEQWARAVAVTVIEMSLDIICLDQETRMELRRSLARMRCAFVLWVWARARARVKHILIGKINRLCRLFTYIFIVIALHAPRA